MRLLRPALFLTAFAALIGSANFAFAGGTGNCGGTAPGAVGTETCGSLQWNQSDPTYPNDVFGYSVGTDGALKFRGGLGASGAELMRLTGTGSLGLGTTTPKVSVDFGSKTDALLLQSGTTGQRPTATPGMIRYNSTTPAVEAYVSNAWSSLLTSSATVTNDTLGSTATAGNPHRSGDLTTGLYSDTASTVEISTQGIEALRVTATGSVGIGTATPANELDVNGNADFAGNVGIGTASPSQALTVGGAVGAQFTANAAGEYCSHFRFDRRGHSFCCHHLFRV